MTTTACPDCGHTDTHSPLSGCLHSTATTFCDCATAWQPPKTLTVARGERDAAMATVQEHTDPAWEAEAVQAITTLAARSYTGDPTDGSRVPFTTDDVWDLLTERGIPAPREPRALGPIVKAAIRDRVIVGTGYTPSRRRHCTPIRAYVGAL